MKRVKETSSLISQAPNSTEHGSPRDWPLGFRHHGDQSQTPNRLVSDTKQTTVLLRTVRPRVDYTGPLAPDTKATKILLRTGSLMSKLLTSWL